MNESKPAKTKTEKRAIRTLCGLLASTFIALNGIRAVNAVKEFDFYYGYTTSNMGTAVKNSAVQMFRTDKEVHGPVEGTCIYVLSLPGQFLGYGFRAGQALTAKTLPGYMHHK